MLDAFGQSNFHFYGKQEPLWHFAFDEIDSQLNIEKTFQTQSVMKQKKNLLTNYKMKDICIQLSLVTIV